MKNLVAATTATNIAEYGFPRTGFRFRTPFEHLLEHVPAPLAQKLAIESTG